MRRFALTLALCLAAGTATAQTNLRIGLGDDGDALDPSLSRFYTTRIVFAALCDKLFDIDEKANIVPQLALGQETSADGKTVTIKLRPGVKFHDGEPMDAKAAKYSLDRHLFMKGSFRRPEIGVIELVDVVDPLDDQTQPQDPVLTAARPTHRPRRHDGLAKGGRGRRRQVRPPSGLRRSLQVRREGGAGQDRGREVRRLLGQGPRLHRQDHLSADHRFPTVRLAALQSGSLDWIERVLATDIKAVRGNPKLRLSKAVSLGWFGLLLNLDNGPKSSNPLGKDPRVRQAFEASIDRDAINQVVFNGEFVPGNQWVSPQSPFYQKSFPVPKRDIAKAKALLKKAGVKTPITLDFMVTAGPETRAVAEVVQSMVAEAGFDLKLRVTEAATAQKQAEDGDYQVYMNNWSGRIDPDGNSMIYQTCGAPMNMGHYCDKEVDALHAAARAATDVAARNAAYEKLTAKFLSEGWIIYLYHPQYLIAHTDKVENFKPMPDGLVRVVGVKLK